jgi:hypothetical protein
MKKSVISVVPAGLVRFACRGVINQAPRNGVSAFAQTVSTSNGSSSASIALNSPTGRSDWLVDGVNILDQRPDFHQPRNILAGFG